MAGTYRLSSRIDWFSQQSLPPIARLAGMLVDRATRKRPTCVVSNETFARRLGVGERTVGLALRALSDSGLIRIDRDYRVHSRRRITPLWKAGPEEGGGR